MRIKGGLDLQHKKLYRIYFTEFNDNTFNNVVNALKQKYNSEVNIIKSNLIEEFKAIELYFEEEGHSDEIKSLVNSITGSQYVRVDYIDTTK